MSNLLITTTPPPPNLATRSYKHTVVLLLNKDVQYMYNVPCDFTMIMNEYLKYCICNLPLPVKYNYIKHAYIF